ncbi:MAG TPA: S41 family peptidase [Spirochaetia bacterium]|nr:S41 family peptidase [Spirochaetia bacterium]
MKDTVRRTFAIFAIPAALLIGLVLGVLIDRFERLPSLPIVNQTTDPAPPDFSLIHQAWDIIDRVYVDRAALQQKPLTYGAIAGMVDALGDTGHSTFLTPEMVAQEQTLTQGAYVGVGIEIQMKNNQVTIVAPLDGSPAARAGLHSGELILKVDGKDVTGLSLQEVVRKIVGTINTDVTLSIYDPLTKATSDVTLRRSRIMVHNVSWHRIPGTDLADIRIAAFSEGVTKDLVKAIGEIEAQHLSGIVLDLRNDPGGILDQAIGVASQFLANGNVLLTKSASGKITPDPVHPGGLATKQPLVVLINDGTASASEIVAGALQDAKRATLIGDTTFGTGTVLGQFPLSDGSELLLATQEWLTPKGRTIWHKGITPDVTVTLPAGTTMIEPDALQGMSPSQLQASGDVQLMKGISLLEQKLTSAESK